jgi:hypothetical protein
VSPRARRIAALPGLVLVFAAARGALHVATFGLPVSNDDAILLLMGRHVLRGELATTLWNQPYNGALDAYLLAPLLAVLPHHGAYRLYQLIGAALLVLLAFCLGERLAGRGAAWAAALLAACGTPYMALMAATGPPPNFLMPLVTGFPLLAALPGADGSWPRRSAAAALGLGLACGLAVWNSSLAIPAFAGMAVGLALAGLRPRPSRALAFAAGLALGALPLAVARAVGASGARVETASSAVTAVRPLWLWSEGVSTAAQALRGLVGLQVPLVIDGKEREALPLPLVLLLAVGLAVALAAGSRTRRALPLLGWGAALAAAYWLARRTGPDDLRYLYGMHAPLLALAGAGVAEVWRRRRALGVALALALVLPWAWGEQVLARSWRDPQHAVRVWEVPPLEPVLRQLDARGVASAYASLQFAGRLTLETGGRVVVSQAWNERIPGDPLRFRDEVDLDPAPAWVLSTRFSRGMPRAGGFRELVRGMGGSFVEEEAGGFSVFHGFRPPYDEARPVPAPQVQVATTDGTALPASVLDRDPATAWVSPVGIGRGAGLVVRVPTARRLSALVLAVGTGTLPHAVPWVVSVDGTLVAQGPRRAGLQWVNGAPRAGRQTLFAIALEDRIASEVRLVFQGPGPALSLAEVFLYGPAEAERPRAGQAAADEAYASARRGRWADAARLYAQAARLEPDRASHHGAWLRASWRASRRAWLDVESLDDGGPELVDVR